MRDRFQQAAEAAGTTVKQFFSLIDARAYLVSLAAGGGVTSSILPEDIRTCLDGLISDDFNPADTSLCISNSSAGIAATGSVLIDLRMTDDRAATALAPIHAVFLDPARIVETLADLEPILLSHLQRPPAYLSLTTGPSRTADIERVLTIGVHGPKELHILLMEGV
ncbi:MAG: lactate utilization protein [Desulfuromonadia bacterium]